jgi:uncharacterized repeat protein (TIGR01451 family)
MHVSRRGSQALALGAGVATLLAIAAPHGYAASTRASAITGLTFTKSVSPGPYLVGSPVTFTLQLSNTSAGNITINPVSDPLPAGLVVTNAVPSDAPASTCTVSPATATVQAAPVGQTVVCHPGVIGSGSSFTITITAMPVDSGSYNNIATATSGANTQMATLATPIQVTGTALRCFGSVPTIFGTPGDDTIDGTDGTDVIVGLAGNDTIDGGKGDDKICGGDGNDHLYGGSGADSLAGGNGSDLVDGGAGVDTVRGGSDSNTPFATSAKHHGPDDWYRDGNRDRGHDVLICERQDSCGNDFHSLSTSNANAADRHHNDRGNRNEQIIWVPLQDHNGGHNGRRGNHRGYSDFAATKPGTPAKPGMKPAAKPVVKPAPAVAGTAPVAPKA